MAYEKKALGKSILIKFEEMISKESLQQLEDLSKEIEQLDSEYKVFIFDMSQLREVAPTCIRPLIYMQGLIRKRPISFLLVIAPKQPLKEKLLSMGGLRSNELCQDRLHVAEILKKKATSDNTCPKGILKVS